jgi:hypothetical protein
VNAGTREHRRSLVEQVAMCPPAVRTVVVQAWLDEPDRVSEHRVYPVLALRSYLSHDYTRPRETGPDRYPETAATHAAMTELGWHHDPNVYATIEAIVAHEEFGLVGTEVGHFDHDNSAHEVVACPWPPDEDEERLAPDRLVEQVAERLRYRASAEDVTEAGD